MTESQNLQIALSLLQTIGLLLPIVIITAEMILNNVRNETNFNSDGTGSGMEIEVDQKQTRIFRRLLIVMSLLAIGGVGTIAYLVRQTSSSILSLSLVILSVSLLAFLPILWYLKEETKSPVEGV